VGKMRDMRSGAGSGPPAVMFLGASTKMGDMVEASVRN
jgi:hypothetical protein